MDTLEKYTENTFNDIKHIDEFGNEYWEARELMPLLEYSKWENFHKVIKRAMIACEASNNNVNNHFPEFRKPIVGGKGNIQYVIDYHLSRYACYLIVQNANPRKKSEELGANLFRITQTEARLKKDNVDNEDDACITYYNVGKTVRKAIEELISKSTSLHFCHIRLYNKSF